MHRYLDVFSGRTAAVSILTNDSQHDLVMEQKKYTFEQDLKAPKDEIGKKGCELMV